MRLLVTQSVVSSLEREFRPATRHWARACQCTSSPSNCHNRTPQGQVRRRCAAPNGRTYRIVADPAREKAGTVEWPQARPVPADLARAGFFYRSAHDSADNVQCFLFTVKLNGSEETDNPFKKHLLHSQPRAWATAISVHRNDDEEAKDLEVRDLLSEGIISAQQELVGRTKKRKGGIVEFLICSVQDGFCLQLKTMKETAGSASVKPPRQDRLQETS